MAKLSADGKYVTVEKGDTLWDIAAKYLGDPLKYKSLCSINDINPNNYIYGGQKIYLYEAGSEPAAPSTLKATIYNFGLRADSDNILFAAWKWDKVKETESYKVVWRYSTYDGTWFSNVSSVSVDQDYPDASRIHTYTIPDGAYSVKFKVMPIAKKEKDSNGNEKTPWTAGWSEEKTYTVKTPLETPPTPTVELDGLTLTATLSNIDLKYPKSNTKIRFDVVKNDTVTAYTGVSQINTVVAGGTGFCSYKFKVAEGATYKVCCRAEQDYKTFSDYSAYSSSVKTRPATPNEISTIRAESKTSVYLEWKYKDPSHESSVETYEVEYATEKRYFDISGQTTKVSNIEQPRYEITGLETGHEYFFRVRAVNDGGESGWSEIKSITIGTKPAAPTTWSSTTTAIAGEPVTLYWVHNTADGSSQTYAELEVYFNGAKELHTIENTSNEDEEDKTSQFVIPNTVTTEGYIIEWRVRTAGVTKEYGDWSITRRIDIHAQPTLELTVIEKDGTSLDLIKAFPFYIKGIAGPGTQVPIGYHLSIIANESYETMDNIGNVKMVKSGEAVYSKYFDTSYELMVEMSPSNVDLENNISYTVKCLVSMNSGLTTEAERTFTVSWTDRSYAPNAEISYDSDLYVTHIRPYCEVLKKVKYRVTYDAASNVYTKTDEQISNRVYSEIVPGAKTTTGELVYNGFTYDELEFYFCEVIESALVENVTLSVYRREFDGSFIELATGLNNVLNTHITDPHPALDYARYRVIATDTLTGSISYYDLPGYPIGEKSVIIQWDEQWSTFDTKGLDDPLDQPPWTGSLLKLPYNVDVSDSYNPDVTFVKYIGRKRQVSYYGTQLGESSTWNVVIQKDDEETLYALRRLATWMGDVYVREPSGTGYWANVTVSFSQKHLDLTIPVSLNIQRVEGGM